MLCAFFWIGGFRVHAVTSRTTDNYILTYWETDDGLPENSATSMVQTQDGYLWFGTFNGLVRFDGAQFTVFDPGNTPELPSPAIVNLYLDRRGAMWCSTMKGLACLSNGQWRRFGREQGWTSDYVRTFAQGRDNILYVTGFDGRILKFGGEQFEQLPDPPGDPHSGYLGRVDADGYFWAAQNGFVGFWDGATWTRVGPVVDPGQEFGAGPAYDGTLWVLEGSTLRKFARDGIRTEIKLKEPIKGFWNLTESGAHEIWICSFSDGIYRVRPNGSVIRYTVESGLPRDAVRFVFQDRESNLWLGTSGGGLMRMKARTFQNYGTESGLAEGSVKSVVVGAAGEVLLGTYGKGVARLDTGRGAHSAVPLKVNHPNFVQSILSDRSGDLWIGTLGEGLFAVGSNATGRVMSGEMSGNTVAAMFEDSRARLWIAFNDRVSVRDGNAFTTVNELSSGKPLTDVRTFEEEPSTGRILAANDRGLFRFEKDGFIQLKDSGGHSVEQILCIKALPDETLWLGTENRGLLRYRKGILDPVGAEQGLPTQLVTTILDDQVGQWWLGSYRGIVRVIPRNLEATANGETNSLDYTLFTVSDGLASIQCPRGFQPTSARGPDGRLWFATLKGVAVVDPKHLVANSNPPPVVIESASFVDAHRRHRELSLTSQSVTLPAGSSQLDVHFTGLSYTAPEKMRFYYRLQRDDELLAAEQITRRSVSVSLLPPGTYTLRVTASNNDGVWNRRGATLSFKVLPFFWQTFLFRVGALAALAGIFGGALWHLSERRVRVQREKFEQQKALAEGKARLASVLEGTSDLVGFATPEGQVLYINPSGRALLGLGADEDVTRLGIREFYSPAANDALRERAILAATRTGTWSGEAVMRTRAGAEILTSQVLLAHKDTTGNVLFLSAIVRDITESRKMEEQLHRSQRMESLGTLASGIAHDFNNVLCAIIGNVELARVDVGSDHSAAESLNEVRKASLRARDLVKQILAFSRQQAQDRKAVSLVPVVDEAIKLLRATLPAAVELTTNMSANAPKVLADASQIHQVVLNLCTNSWHAIEPNAGRIDIRLDRIDLDGTMAGSELPSGAYARLTVQDSGRGMSPDTLEHIFEPFFTTKTRGRGTGLGLAVVHGIVKSHDGFITVTSQPGEGTIFQLFFPAAAVKADNDIPEAERPISLRGHGEHILYIDDEASLVSLATRALERIGYRVTGFTRPEEALAEFRRDPNQFDVVVTDFNMPEMSGLDIAHIFLFLRPEIPVLLTSGYLSDELKNDAHAAGISAVLYKPNTVVELREVIHRWLRERRTVSQA